MQHKKDKFPQRISGECEIKGKIRMSRKVTWREVKHQSALYIS
jgi:hypothetical protein